MVPRHGRFGSPFFERTWRQKEPRQSILALAGSTTDKGDAGPPNYRSRLVVRKIMKTTMKSDVPSAAELFSEMPPLEMVKGTPISLFVSHGQEEAKGKRTLAMYNVIRAHFHGALVRGWFVELPGEEKDRLALEGHNIKYVVFLRKCMYDPVDASARWQAHYAQILKNTSSSLFFVHLERDVRKRSRRLWRCPLMKRSGSKVACS